MFQKKPPPRPKDSAQDLLAALKEAETAHQKRVKQDRRDKKKGKRGNWLADWPGRLKVLAIVLLVGLVALVFDGVRRESAELHAVLSEVQGAVTVAPDGGVQKPGRVGMSLDDKDIVVTGGNSSATITFPDGSAIEQEPDTRFEVRTLDFVRSGRRDRSFMVHAGSVVARFGKFFGGNIGSEGTVCTPTAVAAVRGTGFRVFFEPSKQQTYIAVVEGQVVFRTATIMTQASAGQLGVARGYDVAQPGGLAGAADARIRGQVQRMDRYVKPPGFLQRVEFALNSFLDPFLQILGITPGTWGYHASSAGRRAACEVALTKLRQALEAEDNPPRVLNPITLVELNLDAKLRDAMLESFHGKMLDSYQVTGSGSYIIQVRARDRERTTYQLTPTSLSKVRR